MYILTEDKIPTTTLQDSSTILIQHNFALKRGTCVIRDSFFALFFKSHEIRAYYMQLEGVK